MPEDILLKHIQAEMHDQGYKWLGAYTQFRKQTDLGFQAIILSFSHYEDLSLVEFHYGFRVNALEELVYSYVNVSAAFQMESLSLILSAAKLMEVPFARIEIRDEADAILAGRALLKTNESVGFPFFKSYTSLQAVASLFNDFSNPTKSYFNHSTNRAIRGMALAFLTKHQDKKALAELHRANMENTFALPNQRANFEHFFKIIGSEL